MNASFAEVCHQSKLLLNGEYLYECFECQKLVKRSVVVAVGLFRYDLGSLQGDALKSV